MIRKRLFLLLLVISSALAQSQYDRQQYDQQNRQNQQQYGNQQFGNQQYGNNNNPDDNCCEEYCYYSDEEPYIHFATKTAYESLNSRSRNQQQHIVPDCSPVQFWSLNRHGTRLPEADRIDSLHRLSKLQEEIQRNYEQRRSYPSRGKLCPDDYNLFRRWRWNDTITIQKANSLTRQGVEELRLLARRYKTKFPELFREPYNDRTYNFQYSDSDRTHDSYQAFIEGLFEQDAFKVHANVLSDETLIRPSESCRAWSDNVDRNRQTFSEYQRFTERQEYKQMTRDVFTRLGFRFTLNASVINDIYDMCRYDKAWNVEQRSAWCIAFTKEHLKMLEYAEDLKYYYKFGYGNDINRELGCSTVKDLYDKFDRTVTGGSDGLKASFFFAHTASLLTTLTAMGFFRDSNPLTADNYYNQNRREWRTSKMDPFAANLAAVLYQCRSGERHRVMFFLNENPVELPDCSVGLCNWSTIQQKFRYAAENCHPDTVCNGNSASTSRQNFFYSFVAILFLSLTKLLF